MRASPPKKHVKRLISKYVHGSRKNTVLFVQTTYIPSTLISLHSPFIAQPPTGECYSMLLAFSLRSLLPLLHRNEDDGGGGGDVAPPSRPLAVRQLVVARPLCRPVVLRRPIILSLHRLGCCVSSLLPPSVRVACADANCRSGEIVHHLSYFFLYSGKI